MNVTVLFSLHLSQHHSYHTFLGLVCLMQVSTRSCDFIVDTLKLRRQLGILNDPFTNPNIVKVCENIVYRCLNVCMHACVRVTVETPSNGVGTISTVQAFFQIHNEGDCSCLATLLP